MSAYILAIDQGTTSTRAIVFDGKAQVIAVGQKELALHYPHNGWVEQNPEDIWLDTQDVCRSALRKAGIGARDIAAIGITNQRETTVVWDRETGVPVYNAIVWQDRRTADFCATLEDKATLIRSKTGLLPDPYFSGTKLRWVLENVAGAREKAEQGQLAFGTIDSFLLWRLTDGKSHATDMTNASRTMMYNIVERTWDKDLLALLNIPASLLPEVKDNCAAFGKTSADFLGAEIPVTGMAGDQQAALFGQACFQAGMVKSTYGTGCFALVNIGEAFKESKNKMLTTVAISLEGRVSYAIEGAIFVAGAAVQWLRDELHLVRSAEETEKVAQSVQDNNGVYMVPAFTGLGAPYWNPQARGALVGLSRGTTSAHIVRAALEAQAYQTQDLMAAMAEDAGIAIREIRVDGGMVRNDWMCQFLADITQAAVLRPVVTETTALGAAFLAGLGAGVWASLDDVVRAWQCQKRFIPFMIESERMRLYGGWQHAVKQVLA